MLFNSYSFLLLFLPLVFAGWWSIRGHRARLAFLTGASWLFYGWWDARFVPLMIASTTADYFAARRIASSTSPRTRRAWLVALLAFNLGLLAIFKYAGFLARSANAVSAWLGVGEPIPVLDIILPIGISFYTFNSISYTIDVYRGRIPATASFLEFSAFVAFFPHLIAGPIIRYADIGPQFERPPQKPQSRWLALGLSLLAIGLVKKVLIADAIGPAFVDPLFARHHSIAFVEGWLATFAYSMQLYFDFSGYSDMAVGLGLLLGFRLPWNFNAPYQSASPAEFWRRWHMTLSTWLRDYLFIPLGGSHGSILLTARNLAIVMLLGGLWHGAAWTFVLWGAYHGVLLASTALMGNRLPERLLLPRSVRVALTFVAVMIGWVLFRASSLGDASDMFAAMFGARGSGVSAATAILQEQWWPALVLAAATIIAFVLPDSCGLRIPRRRIAAVAIGCTIAVCALLFARPSPFLYFQF
jgi:D-alanyl-lipoteichoic acid acyltransferase DltB (MBOAT superfamily)